MPTTELWLRSRKSMMPPCFTWLRCWWRRRARQRQRGVVHPRVRENDPTCRRPRGGRVPVGYDSTPIRAEKSLYDVAMWCQDRTAWPPICGRRRRSNSPRNWRTARCLLPPGRACVNVSRSTGKTTATSSTTWISPSHCRWRRHADAGNNQDVPGRLGRESARAPACSRRKARASRRDDAQAAQGIAPMGFPQDIGDGTNMAAVRENALSDIGLGYPLLREMAARARPPLGAGRGRRAKWGHLLLEVDQVRQAVAALERGEPLCNMASASRSAKPLTRRSSVSLRRRCCRRGKSIWALIWRVSRPRRQRARRVARSRASARAQGAPLLPLASCAARGF